MLGRMIGRLFLGVALLLAGGDAVRSLEAGAMAPLSLRGLFGLAGWGSGLDAMMPAWAAVIAPMLRLPAVAVAAVLGLLLLVLFRRRPRRVRPSFG